MDDTLRDIPPLGEAAAAWDTATADDGDNDDGDMSDGRWKMEC